VKLNPEFPWQRWHSRRRRRRRRRRRKPLFTSKIGVKLKKKIVKCFFWITAVYGVETQTL
jgi:hypothetical protein